MSEDKGGTSDAEMMRGFMEERALDRLKALEQEAEKLRGRVRLLGVGLFTALGLSVVAAFWPGVLSVGAGLGKMEVLRVQRLVLEDAEGTARGEWRVDEEGNSRFTLLDRQGRTRLSLAVLSGGSPGLSLIDMDGQRRAALGLLPDQTTNLAFADVAGQTRVVLGLSPADATHLVFADANGVSRVALGLDGTGVATIMLPEETAPTDPGG
jgi:hypothetical protein